MQTGKIETLDINKIKPYWRNPRVNDAAVDAVAQSIKDFGYNVFIVVDMKYVIILGDTRFKALKKLGVPEIKCIVLDIDPKKAKQFRIAENKTGEIAEWNMEALIQEMREIEIPDMQIYFPDLDLVELIKESTGTSKWSEVTAESYAKSVEREAAKIDVLSGKRAAEMRPVTCPHCGEEFSVV